MQQNQSQNPMAVEPVPKLMARIGLPIVLSMILQAAYNVVDSAYLARMATGGETALTALSLAFPVQLFMVAVSIGTGVGTNALLARLLGLGDKDRADAAMGNAQFLALVISAVFMLFSAVGVVPYVNSQSAGGSISGEVLSEAIDYLHRRNKRSLSSLPVTVAGERQLTLVGFPLPIGRKGLSLSFQFV